jgi:hypothetical protein
MKDGTYLYPGEEGLQDGSRTWCKYECLIGLPTLETSTQGGLNGAGHTAGHSTWPATRGFCERQASASRVTEMINIIAEVRQRGQVEISTRSSVYFK